MNRIRLALPLGVLALSSTTAFAIPESVFWFDIRNNSGGIQSISAPQAPFTIGQGNFPNNGAPGGGRGNGDVLRLCPMVSNSVHLHSSSPGINYYPNFDADGNAATGVLNLFCDVLPDADSPTGLGDIMSTIGLDIIIQGPGAPGRYTIASTSFAWNPALLNGCTALTTNHTPVAGGVGGHVNGVYTFAPPGCILGPGLTPGGPYLLGTLQVTASPRTCNFTGPNTHATGSTYSVSLSVNAAGVTRAFPGGGGNAVLEERISLGYTGGVPEADVSGNTMGGVGVRDAIIQVRMKNDSNGSGNVNTLDVPGFLAAQAAGFNITQDQRYLHDRNNSGNVNSIDISGFNFVQAAPCP